MRSVFTALSWCDLQFWRGPTLFSFTRLRWRQGASLEAASAVSNRKRTALHVGYFSL
jgi:hypothetical protein